MPHWINRDRFILSNGHASMLQYSLLHLTGYPLSLDDVRSFRQWGSNTPGHPENHLTPGVETTTGPLGQGVATSVGMAMAAKWFAARFDQPGFELFDYDVYALCSDGDVMEGVASEAASIAGHLQLGKLTVFWDDNEITIDGLGCHAAMPHLGRDPIVTGAEVVLAMQALVARTLNPMEHAVVSFTEFVTNGDSRARKIAPSLVLVNFDMPYTLSGVSERFYYGTGVVVGATVSVKVGAGIRVGAVVGTGVVVAGGVPVSGDGSVFDTG